MAVHHQVPSGPTDRSPPRRTERRDRTTASAVGRSRPIGMWFASRTPSCDALSGGATALADDLSDASAGIDYDKARQ